MIEGSSFVVCSILQFYDAELAKRLIRWSDSPLYKPSNSLGFYTPKKRYSISYDDMRMLMDALFLGLNFMHVEFCAAFEVNESGFPCPVKWYNFDGYEGAPHPQLNNYVSLGGLECIIRDAIERNEPDETIINLLEEACGALNFADIAVMKQFMKLMYDSDKKFIRLSNRKLVTPKEAIEHLRPWYKGGEW